MMPFSTLIWLAGPLILLCLIVGLAVRRAAQRRDAFDAARARGRHSEAGLASAMSEAITRMRGQVLWTLEGTEPLRSVARDCLHADARCDASLVGPGAPGAAVRVTAVPLRSAGGDPEGVLYLVDVERVS